MNSTNTSKLSNAPNVVPPSKIQVHDIEIVSPTCIKLTLPFRKTAQDGGEHWLGSNHDEKMNRWSAIDHCDSLDLTSIQSHPPSYWLSDGVVSVKLLMPTQSSHWHSILPQGTRL